MQLFESTDYKKYLTTSLDKLSEKKRGVRTQFAEALNCQPGYISQTLNGMAHLSLEQAELANGFLGHTDEESEYFLLLVQYARASTTSLKIRLEKQMQRYQEQHLNLKHRFKVKDKITEKNQAIFYGHWHYIAILAALGVPKLQSKEALSDYFKIPVKRVSEVLEFLIGIGMAKAVGNRFLAGETRTHLGANPPMIIRHHTNWRLQAIQSIEKSLETDLHYSSVITVSRSDMQKIKMRLIKELEQIKAVIRESKDEAVCSFSMDLFEL